MTRNACSPGASGDASTKRPHAVVTTEAGVPTLQITNYYCRIRSRRWGPSHLASQPDHGVGTTSRAPLDLSPTQEEVASTSGDSPHRRRYTHRPVRALSCRPPRTDVGKQVELNELPTPAGANEGDEPKVSAFPDEIHGLLLRLIWDLVGRCGGPRPVFPAEEASYPRPRTSNPPHRFSPSVSSGMSRRGRESPRPTRLANIGHGSPSGNFMNSP